MSDFLFQIKSADDVIRLVDHIGFLPFFGNHIPGFSVEECCPRELRKMQDADATEDEQAVLIQKYFGSVGRDVCLCPGFMCDSGKNIHVGDQFFANYMEAVQENMKIG